MKRILLGALRTVAAVGLWPGLVSAWDYEGHRLVNQLALASLPAEFPVFVRDATASERIAFLAGEPDRWRNVQDLQMRHCNGPDHYIDLEQLNDYGLKPEALPIFRYDFVSQLAFIREVHPERFAKLNEERNEDHTRQLVGLLPWAIAENYSKLKSGFSYLKALENGGTREEIANAEANIIYVMGVMGHYAGDAGQPLHTTIHHHGWVGENPHHYTTNSKIHGWIDGGYFSKVGGADVKSMQGKLRPAKVLMIQEREAKPGEMVQVAVRFIQEQLLQVEPLYELEKEGKLSGNGEVGMKGKVFLEGQIVKSAQLLGDIWYSAWQQAPVDSYLESQLSKRKSERAAAEKN